MDQLQKDTAEIEQDFEMLFDAYSAVSVGYCRMEPSSHAVGVCIAAMVEAVVRLSIALCLGDVVEAQERLERILTTTFNSKNAGEVATAVKVKLAEHEAEQAGKLQVGSSKVN